MLSADSLGADSGPWTDGRGRMKRRGYFQDQAQAESLDEWMADRIWEQMKGRLSPTREAVIRELNRKRRKEGIYGCTRSCKKSGQHDTRG